MVKADCFECQGCCDCCTGMGDTVILDPLDVHRLSQGLGKNMEELLSLYLEFGVADGNILPHMRMTGQEERCVFLNAEGRCCIHPYRPGFCRLFPLGRYYENGSFSYFCRYMSAKRKKRGQGKGAQVDRYATGKEI